MGRIKHRTSVLLIVLGVVLFAWSIALTDIEIPGGAVNLGPNVNSLSKEYAPVISADGNTLYFTSNRPGGLGYTDFWFSKLFGSSWGPASNLGPPINTPLPEGTCTINPNQTMVIFAICDEPGTPQGQRKGQGSCDLFWSHLRGDYWSQPTNLGSTVNTKFWESRPSIGADGRTLYFASWRPVGLAESYWQYLDGDYSSKWPANYRQFDQHHDIYVTQLNPQNNSWGKPRRLGSAVNTRGQDTSPFIHADGVSLYFSSNARGGVGGLDIFRATKQQNGTFGNAISLAQYDPGQIINTQSNDYFFTIPASGDVGYLARSIGGSQSNFDIFKVPLPYDLRPQRMITLSGIVYNAHTVNKEGAKASVYIIDPVTNEKKRAKADPIGKPATISLIDMSTGEVAVTDQSHPTRGKYTVVIKTDVRYKLKVIAEDFLPYEIEYFVPKTEPKSNFRLDIPMKRKLTTLTGVVFNAKTVGKEGATANVMLIDPVTKMAEDVKANPIAGAEVLIVDAATGNVVKKTLSKEGSGVYAVQIMTGKKYTIKVSAPYFMPYEATYTFPGEKAGGTIRLDIPLKPKLTILSGYLYNLKSIDKSGSAISVYFVDPLTNARRVVKAKPIDKAGTIKVSDFNTLSVVKTVQTQGTSGKYSVEVESGKKYNIEGVAQCFFANKISIPVPIDKAGEKLRADIPLRPMVPGEGVVLPNIFFDFAKATLKPESYPALNKVIELMKEYPRITVELGGHTDCVGSDKYNMSLSQRRAESCRQYLIQQGIAESRIFARGYGESTPIEDYCHPKKGNARNRRTEFKILSGLECN